MIQGWKSKLNEFDYLKRMNEDGITKQIFEGNVNQWRERKRLRNSWLDCTEKKKK